MEVFLLEDDAAIGMGLSYALENEGDKTTLTKTGSEALKLVEEKAFCGAAKSTTRTGVCGLKT